MPVLIAGGSRSAGEKRFEHAAMPMVRQLPLAPTLDAMRHVEPGGHSGIVQELYSRVLKQQVHSPEAAITVAAVLAYRGLGEELRLPLTAVGRRPRPALPALRLPKTADSSAVMGGPSIIYPAVDPAAFEAKLDARRAETLRHCQKNRAPHHELDGKLERSTSPLPPVDHQARRSSVADPSDSPSGSPSSERKPLTFRASSRSMVTDALAMHADELTSKSGGAARDGTYMGSKELFAAVERGEVALLKASWLLQRAGFEKKRVKIGVGNLSAEVRVCGASMRVAAGVCVPRLYAPFRPLAHVVAAPHERINACRRGTDAAA
jgi:hypothetical protein